MKEKGYRLNVGLIIANGKGKLLLCKRKGMNCLLYTSPSPRDRIRSRMPSSA